jgi:thioredoxin-related protein
MKPTRNILLLLFFLIPVCNFASSLTPASKISVADSSKINWMTIEEAYALSQKEPRKIFIKVYTDWCGWCKKMDKTTFTDPSIVEYINTNFYAVQLNGEDKRPITLGDKTFKLETGAKTHQLAQALLQGKISYPTTVYLDEEFNMLAPVAGYLEAPALNQLLHFYGENYYETMPWDHYIKNSPEKNSSPK